MTDRDAVRVALYIALDTERSLVDGYNLMRPGGAHRVDDEEPGVITARKNIAAFKRVLRNRYGHEVADHEMDEARHD